MLNDKNKLYLNFVAGALGLLVLVFLVFKVTGQFEFLNFDDNVYITENVHVNTGLNWTNAAWAFSKSYAGYWNPLAWISHQLDCQFFGLNAGSHHLVNVLLHSINALLLFCLLYQLFGSMGLAWILAALFAVHPERIESVAWIAERKDVLSLFFGLLTLLFYERYRIKKKISYYLLVILSLSLGLLAKPSLMVMPFLLLLLDFWPLSDWKLLKGSFWKMREKLILEKLPLLFLCFVSAVIVVLAQKQAGALQSLNDFTLPDRFSSAFVGYLGYLGKTIWPHDLDIFYPFVIYPPGVGLGAFIVFILTTIAVVKLRKKYPYLLFGWGWFVISLAPVIGFVQVGGQSMADRWSYLPHVGLAIALCGYLSTFKLKKSIYAVLIVLLILSVYKTRSELPHWKDSEAVFNHALEINPNNFLAHANLGEALANRGQQDLATYHYEESVRINPLYAEAVNNLGGIKAKQGDLLGAITLFERALNRNPNDIPTRYNLGLAHYNLGQKIKALDEWLLVLHINPDYQPAKSSLRYMAVRDFKNLCPLTSESKLEAPDLIKNLSDLKFLSSKDGDLSEAFNSLNMCLRQFN